jgi:hypothetical protein
VKGFGITMLFGTMCLAQVPSTSVGLQPLGSYQGGFDKINLANPAVYIDIPLFTHKSRGVNNGISVQLVYDNGSSPDWRVVAASAGGGGSVYGDYQTLDCAPPDTDKKYQVWTYYFVDQTGYRHKFPGNANYYDTSGGGICTTVPYTSLNSSVDGYALSSASGSNAVVTDPSGGVYSMVNGNTSGTIDSNGNTSVNNSLLNLKDSSNILVSVTGGNLQYDQNGSPTSRTPTVV